VTWNTGWAGGPCRTYEGTFGITREEQRLFAVARKGAEALIGSTLPLVQQHNDFDPWNMTRAGDELHVLDWERSAIGPPITDLQFFTLAWTRSPAA
jgi:thiamine kinase-like enzyme